MLRDWASSVPDRLALFTGDQFADVYAKTAHGILRYADREVVAVVDTAQAYRLADSVSDGEGSMAEPLSVALHAVRRAGSLLGKHVLVTGCGPIGAMIVIAARHAGATSIVVTDVASSPLRSARKVGADETINVAEQPDALSKYTTDKGHFDVLFEASGNEPAPRTRWGPPP